jgi:predicted membrane protein
MERWARKQEYWSQRGSSGRDSAVIAVPLVALGAIFLLQNLRVIPYLGDFGEFWPLFLIAWGISRVSSGQGAGRPFGALMIVLGLGFLGKNLGYFRFNFWQVFWPLMLMGFGISLLFRRSFCGTRIEDPPNPQNAATGLSDMPSAGTSIDQLNDFAFFGGVERRVDSQNFQGGAVEAVFGGVEINMRSAGTTRSEVVVKATAIFGGVEIITPDNWDVVVRGSGIFGGFEDKTLPRPKDGTVRPKLIIEGSAIFGGVSIL